MKSARTRVIIGGVRTPELALAVVEHGGDGVGFVFAPASPVRLDPEPAYEIMAALPPLVSSVGVLVNPSLEEFSDAEEICPTTHTVLAGAEPEKLVRQCGPGVVKAIAFDPHSLRGDIERWLRLDEVDAVQVDLAQGATDHLALLADAVNAHDKPVILGGVLLAKSAIELVRAVRPYALHVTLGVDDAEPEIAEWCERVRRAHA
jgi:phosphoribosylanthranilate isomerase